MQRKKLIKWGVVILLIIGLISMFIIYEVKEYNKVYADLKSFSSSLSEYEHIGNINFVSYLPSKINEFFIEKSWDITDRKLTKNKKQVICWVEETSEDRYDIFIGSTSPIYAKNLDGAFAFLNADNINFSNLDTSETVSMESMFRNFGSYNLDISTFDTSKVKNMSYMFEEASTVIIFPKDFGVSATTMEEMFFDYYLFDLDLSNFNTRNVENMKSMFNRFLGKELDLSSFNTKKLKNTEGMFSGAYNLEELNLKNWELKNIEKRDNMFSYVRRVNIEVDKKNEKYLKNILEEKN